MKLIRNFLKNYLGIVFKQDIYEILLKEYLVHGDPSKLSIAKNATVNNALFNLASGSIFVDEYVFFGHNVSILTGTHDFSKIGKQRKEAVPRQGNDIIINKGVWIASNTTVMGPSTIGENSVIGACSLVIGDVPPNSLYFGTPAKFVKDLSCSYQEIQQYREQI
ncbi:acyltransferase [Calothrix sp. FACHB-156]|nr:acyltransferase [Calothrix sp. FACHB-156]